MAQNKAFKAVLQPVHHENNAGGTKINILCDASNWSKQKKIIFIILRHRQVFIFYALQRCSPSMAWVLNLDSKNKVEPVETMP